MKKLILKAVLFSAVIGLVSVNATFAATAVEQSTQPVKPKFAKVLLDKKSKGAPANETVGAAEFGAKSTKVVKDVTLSDTIRAEIGGKSVELKRVTSGLRQKKVALFWASVYVGQVFTNASVDFTSIDSVNSSLNAGLPVAVTMTFVRDIPIDKIVDGYKEVFEANGVKADEQPYAEFLDAVKKSGDIKDKQTYYFTFAKSAAGKNQFSFWTNGKERFILADTSPEVLKHLFGMWFGKAIDAGLVQLQEQWLKHE